MEGSEIEQVDSMTKESMKVLAKTTFVCKLPQTTLRIRMKKCEGCGGYFNDEDLVWHEANCLNEDEQDDVTNTNSVESSNENERKSSPDIKNLSTSVVFMAVLVLLLSIVVLQGVLFHYKQPIKNNPYEMGTIKVCTRTPHRCTRGAKFYKFDKSLLGSTTTIDNPYVLEFLDWHGNPASAMVANGKLFFCEDLLCDFSGKDRAIFGTWERRLEYLNWRKEKRILYAADATSLVMYHLDWNGNKQVSEVVVDNVKWGKR